MSTYSVRNIEINEGLKFTEGGEPITWNSDDYTLNIPTGLGPVLQVGQEEYTIVYNNTGATISNGTALYPIGAVNGRPSVTPSLSQDHTTISGSVLIATMDIPHGEEGIATKKGRVDGIDTTGWNLGDSLYVSPDLPGKLTNIRPKFPDYVVQVGGVTNVGVTDGSILININLNIISTVGNFFNGTFRESVNFNVTSDGTNVKGTLTPKNGNPDTTMIFSDGLHLISTTPGAEITLTPGTDTNPQMNLVYIPISTKILTVSLSEWPIEEHIKVANISLRSALATQDDGALINRNWDDNIQDTISNQGYLSTITQRIRQNNAEWNTGCLGSVTINTGSTPDDVFLNVTSGSIYQLDLQSFPALDMALGVDAHIVNHSTTPLLEVSNLNTQTLDSNGNTLNNRSFSFVLWGVVNSANDNSHLMVNLPTNSYGFTDSDTAISDPSNFSVYSIPREYRGVGFLISRFTFTLKNDEWVLIDTEDLRGFTPNVSAGSGGGSGGVTDFTGLIDTPSTYIGEGGKCVQVNSSETGLEFTDKVGTISGILESPEDKDYRLIINIPYGGTITETTTICTSGSGISTWKVSGVSLGSTNAVSSTEEVVSQTTDNTFVVGDDIVLTMSGVTDIVDMSFTIKYTY